MNTILTITVCWLLSAAATFVLLGRIPRLQDRVEASDHKFAASLIGGPFALVTAVNLWMEDRFALERYQDDNPQGTESGEEIKALYATPQSFNLKAEHHAVVAKRIKENEFLTNRANSLRS